MPSFVFYFCGQAESFGLIALKANILERYISPSPIRLTYSSNSKQKSGIPTCLIFIGHSVEKFVEWDVFPKRIISVQISVMLAHNIYTIGSIKHECKNREKPDKRVTKELRDTPVSVCVAESHFPDQLLRDFSIKILPKARTYFSQARFLHDSEESIVCPVFYMQIF